MPTKAKSAVKSTKAVASAEPKKVGAVQLWYGANQSLITVDLERWVALFQEKHPGAQVVKLTLGKGDEAEAMRALHQAANGGGLFMAQQLLVLKGFLAAELKSELGKLIIDLASESANGTVIIFCEGARLALSKGLGAKLKALAEEGSVVIKEFAEFSDAELERWITDRAKAQGVLLAPGAARRLEQLTGQDFVRLVNELDKLGAYRKGEQVQLHDVDELVAHDDHEEVFAFLDAVGRRDFGAAQAALAQQFRQGASPQSLVGLLAWHLRVITSVREAIDAGKRQVQPRELATELGFHPFVVSKALQQLPYYSRERLIWLYTQLSELDVALKSKPIDPQVLFGLFLSKLASLSLGASGR